MKDSEHESNKGFLSNTSQYGKCALGVRSWHPAHMAMRGTAISLKGISYCCDLGVDELEPHVQFPQPNTDDHAAKVNTVT